ncbi:hypothetical protein [Chloracidobacterium thermophilum]|uniref:hypothetical protein n=1 Tax=Chloracidobacterium thermophilum TaxID=458033 RepID=UPI0012FEE07E|nr:hypothetical protein [Chloracidobacterium thermophilum]
MPSAPLFSPVAAFSSVLSEPGRRRGLLALGFSAIALVLVGCDTKDTPKPPDQPAQAAPTEQSPAPPAKAAPAEDDLEIISTDKKKKTITFRDKKTGKTETLPMDEFYKRTSEREKARAQNAQPQAQPGIKEVKPEDLPPWVVIYPNAEIKNNLQAENPNTLAGRLIMASDDAPETVASFYEKLLKDSEFTVVRTGSSETQAVSARRQSGEVVMVSAMPNKELKKTGIMLNYLRPAPKDK